MTSIALEIRTPFGPGAFSVRMRGVLDEMSELSRRLASLDGAVIYHLDELSRITSFGIRDWLELLKTTKATYYAFTHCRPALIRQFNMIRGFGGSGELISYYVPCICTSCGHDFEMFVDLRVKKVSRAADLILDRCPSCDGLAEFDEFDDYFDFPARCPTPKPPRQAQLLMGMAADLSKLTISKRVHGDVTRLSLFGALGKDSKLHRWVDGLQGEVQLEMGGLLSVSPEGIAQLAQLIAHSSVPQCFLHGVRFANIEELRPLLSEKTTIASVIAPCACSSCHATVEAFVSENLRPAPNNCHHCVASDSLIVPNELARTLTAILRKKRKARKSSPLLKMPFVASSASFKRVIETATNVAQSSATCLILGETGTGKELVARHIHSMSKRRDQPFVAVNCGAFPEGLIESELFGHEEGAFTGASSRRIGRFEQADTGTLFLDEVGELPPSTQVKLLRTLQERYIERVGSHHALPIDIRLIAATNRDIQAMTNDGRFRTDLYYRLNVVPLRVPALRDRKEEVLDLVDFFLARFQASAGKAGITISKNTGAALLAHDWPGNVRELINWVERVVALTPSHQEIHIDQLGSPQATEERGHSLKDEVEQFERTLITRALSECNGNRTAAAAQLGISRQALRHKLIKHGLTDD